MLELLPCSPQGKFNVLSIGGTVHVSQKELFELEQVSRKLHSPSAGCLLGKHF